MDPHTLDGRQLTLNASRRRMRAHALRDLLGLAASAWLVGACSGAPSGAPEKFGSSTSPLNAAPTINNFAIYAARSVVIGGGAHVSGGDVGVREVAPSSFGPQVTVGNLATVLLGSDIIAPSVSLTNAIVGDIEANTEQNNGVVVLGQKAPFPSVMPRLPVVTAPPSGADVTVPAFQIKALSPGTYGNLSLTGTLQLTTGTYNFSKVTIADLGHFAVQSSPVVVNVAQTFTSGQGVTILPPLGQPASNLSINVAGSDASSSSPAVSIGNASTIVALLAAPHGTVSFGNTVTATGAFAGYDVKVGAGANVTYQKGFVASTTNPQGSQTLTGYFTPAIAQTPVLGPVPPSTPMHVSIGLPSQNPAQLVSTVQAVSDPTSSQYRSYVTPATFGSLYGALASDYGKVSTWAAANGLTATTYPNNLLVSISGTAATLEAALFVNFEYRQRPDGTQFFALDQDPSLNLAPTVLRISGTDNLLVSKRSLTGSGKGGFYASVDLRAAYAPCTTLDGTGQFIGLFELDGFNQSDINTYTSTIPGTYSFPLATVQIDGFSGVPSGMTNNEVPGDIEQAFAMAPGAEVISYEAAGGSLASNNDVLTVMATNSPLPTQLSSSWYYTGDANTQNIFNEFALQGQTFFEASGDFGAYVGDPQNIYDSSNITLVGGTLLTTSGPATSVTTPYVSETTWNDSRGISSGGILSSVPIPFYQAGIDMSTNGGSTQFRNAPDVSMVADNLLGAAGGLGGPFVGTSMAAPLWAGFVALINEQAGQNGVKPVGFINPALYAIARDPARYALAFHDVNDGSKNPSSDGSQPGFSAVAGYDLATGLGSPACGLLDQLAPAPNVGPPTGGGNPPPTFAIQTGAVLTQVGPEICTSGTGFTPGAVVTATYTGIPGANGVSSSGSVAVVQPDETFALTDTNQEFILQIPCTDAQSNGTVTVTVVDGGGASGVGTGRSATAQLPASLWCPNALNATIIGNGCPP